MHDHTPALAPMIEAIADAVATRVVDRLTGGQKADMVSHRESPIGSRRFISAVRSGAMPGVRVGRTWLARRADVERYMASLGSGAVSRRTTEPEK